jgi:hypothetical protein
MSYIGQTLPADTFQGFTTDSFTGDGSATTFTLSKTPFNESALLVVINNVVQKPTTNFTVSGTTLTIVGTAVASGDVIYATHIGGALPIGQAASLDLNGASDQLILDADADTTISADTDDQIDFKTGGEDSFIMANGGVLTLLNGTTPTINLQDGTTTKGQVLIDQFDQLKLYNKIDDDLILGTNDVGRLTIKNDGKFATGGEGTPDVSVGGITLDLNAEDGNVLTCKSSDVAHGITGYAEADTFFQIRKLVSASGGAVLRGWTEGEQAIQIFGAAESANTTKSTTGEGICAVTAYVRSGTSPVDPGSDANLFVVNQGGNAKFIVDTEGQLHSDGGAQSAYDTYEDAQLVRAFDLSHGRGVIDSKFDKFISYNHEKLADMKLVGREEDGTPNHFINVTGMQRLHNGAIWQQYEKHQKLAEAVYEMAKEALGQDKADAILEKHDIKLLN